MAVLIWNTLGGGGEVAQTIVSGYYKFGAATILRGFNGATAVIEYEEDSDGGYGSKGCSGQDS